MDKCRVLAVEDTQFNRQFLQLSLKGSDIELVFAENGAECLSVLKQDGAFSLILMDIETPVLSGADACKIIKETYPPNLKSIPIVAVTGHNKEEYLEELMQNGFDAYLVKPYKKADLMAVIDEYAQTEATGEEAVKPTLSNDDKKYNLTLLEEWASGDEHMIRELVTVFVKEAPAKLKELKKACNKSDWLEVQNIAHSFAPQLSFIGLEKSFEETSQIEELAIEKKETDKIDLLLKHVEVTCRNAIFELKKDFQL